MSSPTAEQLKLTPTETRLYEALADGECHGPEELIPLIDEHADKSVLKQHIFNLRGKMLSWSEDIVAQSFGRHSKYRRVILLRRTGS